MPEASRPRTVRVVMAVNNPGTTDNRVAKSAEAMAAAGYDCHVVGILKRGFAIEEQRSGVHYHRVPLVKGLKCLLAGFGLAAKLLPRRTPEAERPPGRRSRLRLCLGVPLAMVRLVSLSLTFVPLPLLAAMRETFRLGPHTESWADRSVRTARRWSQNGLLRLTVQAVGLMGRFIGAVLLGLLTVVLFVTFLPLASIGELVPPGSSNAPWEDRVISRAHAWTLRLVRRASKCVGIAALGSKVMDRLRRVSVLNVANMRGRYARALAGKLRDLEGDIYHAHELWTLEACALAARANGAKLVYDSHELEAHRNARYSRLERWLWVRHERRQIRFADRVIAVSPGCARELQRTYGLPEVTVLRNVPWYGQKPPEVPLREALGLGRDVPLVVYVGSVTFHRGLVHVLEALHYLPGFVLATVGPWREDVREELLAHVKEDGLRGRFIMHPSVPPAALPALIADADVSVIPIENVCLSYYHCLPNKLFESAAAGVPVVVSDFPDMRAFVEANDIGRVCDPCDPRSIAEAIEGVYRNRHRFYSPEKRERLRTEHCFDTECQTLGNVYEQLAPRRLPSDAPTIPPGEAHVSTA